MSGRDLPFGNFDGFAGRIFGFDRTREIPAGYFVAEPPREHSVFLALEFTVIVSDPWDVVRDKAALQNDVDIGYPDREGNGEIVFKLGEISER